MKIRVYSSPFCDFGHYLCLFCLLLTKYVDRKGLRIHFVAILINLEIKCFISRLEIDRRISSVSGVQLILVIFMSTRLVFINFPQHIFALAFASYFHIPLSPSSTCCNADSFGHLRLYDFNLLLLLLILDVTLAVLDLLHDFLIELLALPFLLPHGHRQLVCVNSESTFVAHSVFPFCKLHILPHYALFVAHDHLLVAHNLIVQLTHFFRHFLEA